MQINAPVSCTHGNSSIPHRTQISLFLSIPLNHSLSQPSCLSIILSFSYAIFTKTSNFPALYPSSIWYIPSKPPPFSLFLSPCSKKPSLSSLSSPLLHTLSFPKPLPAHPIALSAILTQKLPFFSIHFNVLTSSHFPSPSLLLARLSPPLPSTCACLPNTKKGHPFRGGPKCICSFIREFTSSQPCQSPCHG